MENVPTSPRPRSGWLKILRVGLSVAAFVVGGMIVLVTAAVGHCSAFGGRCPRPSAVDADVFRGAALGTMLAVGGVLFVRRPSWRGLLWALSIASLVALPVGVLVMGATRG